MLWYQEGMSGFEIVVLIPWESLDPSHMEFQERIERSSRQMGCLPSSRTFQDCCDSSRPQDLSCQAGVEWIEMNDEKTSRRDEESFNEFNPCFVLCSLTCNAMDKNPSLSSLKKRGSGNSLNSLPNESTHTLCWTPLHPCKGRNRELDTNNNRLCARWRRACSNRPRSVLHAETCRSPQTSKSQS